MATRIVITGAPRSGKSTLARRLSAGTVPVVRTDDYVRMGVPHAHIPDVARRELERHDSWILEGCQAARVLRRHPDVANGARVYYHSRSVVHTTPGQDRQAKGIHTVWLSARPLLQGAIIVPQEPASAQVTHVGEVGPDVDT